MAIPKKVLERMAAGLKQLVPIVRQQRARDISEADTVTLVKDLLADVFGFDKWAELTGEVAIRGVTVHRPGWGLVHFSADRRLLATHALAENMDLSPSFPAEGPPAEEAARRVRQAEKKSLRSERTFPGMAAPTLRHHNATVL